LTVNLDPWHIVLKNSQGEILTSTHHISDTKSLLNSDQIPFAYTKSVEHAQTRIGASFTLSPDEKIFGCGESFTRLNKRGQRIDLYTTDACGVQTQDMYKPIPFFMSDKGYGMFVHSSALMTFDIGNTFDQANTLYLDEDELDVFVFFGTPKEILSSYTKLTGRSPMPPLWSFGLWMSRITYSSEAEVREVADKLQQWQIPCDVIHIDTGWFETDWQCDYQFSHSRFEQPAEMIADLKKRGLRVSLWQLPYFTPQNPMFRELVELKYAVTDGNGRLPTDDAIIDFSHPEAVKWYQDKLASLLKMGVAAIKVDFGEAAPVIGHYASGQSGVYEHNLYPLRYNKAAANVTKEVTGENIIWARSAWAGSQRYPLHWGGDAEVTFSGMAATLRGGLSLGLCGFSFWSHDIGGFVQRSPEALYRRWLPFGMLTSHSRCHGVPPREPWEYGEAFTDEFREAVALKYKLMPYLYTQARLSSEQGYPMMRTLFFEFPHDPASWLIEDEYMLGSDLLVAPLFADTTQRLVYVPPGIWVDYQTGAEYEGERWHCIAAGSMPIVLLVKAGSVIPHAQLAQTTDLIDWKQIELKLYFAEKMNACEGLICLPHDAAIYPLCVKKENGSWNLVKMSLPNDYFIV